MEKDKTIFESLDKTIVSICEYVDSDIKRATENSQYLTQETVDMIKALAELVSARAM
ncbi:hypothetical protein [Clostridium sp. YIM B02506]|uniref:hypothetical protein n=1 Tax=Clostridium sp. YIM B02506 TaxID=2910680 RepID=UPI001EEEF8CE|nr:hypothetical protein [Clostridium sp. YIM B02506]